MNLASSFLVIEENNDDLEVFMGKGNFYLGSVSDANSPVDEKLATNFLYLNISSAEMLIPGLFSILKLSEFGVAAMEAIRRHVFKKSSLLD